MIEKIKYWIKCVKEYPNLKASYDYLFSEWKENSKRITQLKSENKKLTEKITSADALKKDERYFTSKHPIKNINYVRHETDGEYQVDVRSFCMKDYVYPIFQGTNDEKMRRILIWVIEYMDYVNDKTEYGFDEYWAFPYQTMNRRKGDCEDGAILIWAIALANGIPYYRIRLNAGWVKEPYGTKVGHAYVSYFRESDNEAVVLDWCYYPSYAKIEERLTHKQERDYYEIWWSTDTENSYGNKKYMGEMPEEKFKVEAVENTKMARRGRVPNKES